MRASGTACTRNRTHDRRDSEHATEKFSDRALSHAATRCASSAKLFQSVSHLMSHANCAPPRVLAIETVVRNSLPNCRASKLLDKHHSQPNQAPMNA